MSRNDGRSPSELRPATVELNFQRNPEGSVVYRCGGTMVLVAASVSDKVPDWMAGTGKGWVTAEYAMHPRANPVRQRRDGRSGKVDGRSTEIQRLIARSLRATVNMERLGERMVSVDCDVLDADGGTRTASITAGFVALAQCLDRVNRQQGLRRGVLHSPLAAVSVGMVNGEALLDLDYSEDSRAQVDLNVAAVEKEGLVEVQGTAEDKPIARDRFDGLVDLALQGIAGLHQMQRETLKRGDVDLEFLLDE